MKIVNRRAKFNYEFLDRIEAGIVLTGDDIVNLRLGKVSLKNAYAKLIGNEVFLLSSGMPSRKLLLNRHEIREIEAKIKARKLTLVPTKLYNKRHLIKVELALARSKKKFEKREIIKRRDLDRELM